MQAEYRTESAELKPSYQHFLEILIINITAVEASDICCPPRNTRQSHIKPGGELAS